MKKNEGIIFIEVLVSIVIFSIILFPLIEFNNEIFKINQRLLILKKEYINFNALRKQVRVKDFKELENSIGNYECHIENGKIRKNGFLDNIILPYKISKNSKIRINIYPIKIISSSENYRYITVEVMYIINNKKLKSKEIVSRFGENSVL